ncbi:MAG: ATP-binding protein [Raoultibacter sp.]
MIPSELKTLIEKTEAMQAELQTVEVKKAHDGCPKRLYDTLSSFSNQDEGGIILFGLDEEQGFKKVGVYDVHDLQKKVTEQSDQMHPVVRPLFTVYEEAGLYFVSAEIPAIDLSERPCFYGGKGKTTGSYRRVGDADQRMTEYEIYSYEAFRKKYQDDVRIIPGCDFASLDSGLLNNYLFKLKLNKPNLAQLDDEKIFSLMNIKKEAGVTLAAEWLFGIYPQAYIPQLCVTAIVVPGNEIGEVGAEGERFIDNKRIEGTIPAMLSEALAFVRSNMKTQTSIDSQTGNRYDTTEYPVAALREIILNALIHRDYSLHTEGMPIQIIMYADRIEVKNPGGLYGRLRLDQLGKMQPDTRNPVIATAMEVLGLTENRYSGIPTILREMEKAQLPAPVFAEERDSFVVVLEKRRKVLSQGTFSQEESLLEFCRVPRSRQEITEFLQLGSQAYAIRAYVTPCLKSGSLVMTLPQTPRSSKQRYVTPAH